MTTDLALYKGREQTLVKHELFGRYIQRFANIIASQWDSITYVDCFSGPWEEKSPNFSDTSFGIALKHLQDARDTVAKIKTGKHLKLRFFFVEKSQAAYDKLERLAAAHRGPHIEIVTVKGEFEMAIPEIVKFVKAAPNTFPFFFIDPTGWSGFAMERLEPIFALPRLEMMINLMTGHVRRFVKTDPSMPALFGYDIRPELKDLDGLDLEDAAVKGYMAELRRRGKFTYVVPAIILKPGENRTHFHIIYATRHQKGLEVFKEAERAAVGVMNEARAGVNVEKNEGAQGLLFAAAACAPQTVSQVEDLKARYVAVARERVRTLLQKLGSVPYDRAWEEAVQGTPLVWECDLKGWVKDWAANGELEIPTLQHRRKVPQRGENHVLKIKGRTLS